MNLVTTNKFFCLLKDTVNRVNEHMTYWKITVMCENDKGAVTKMYENNQVT